MYDVPPGTELLSYKQLSEKEIELINQDTGFAFLL